MVGGDYPQRARAATDRLNVTEMTNSKTPYAPERVLGPASGSALAFAGAKRRKLVPRRPVDQVAALLASMGTPEDGGWADDGSDSELRRQLDALMRYHRLAFKAAREVARLVDPERTDDEHDDDEDDHTPYDVATTRSVRLDY